MTPTSEIRKSQSELSPAFWRPVGALASRELVRFFRQRTRVVGALGQPILFWVLFGAGLHDSFQPPRGRRAP